MINRLNQRNRLEDAVLEVMKEYASLGRPQCCHHWTEDLLRYELVACMLGSQVKFEHASAATKYLQEQGFLSLDTFSMYSHEEYERRLAIALSRPVLPPFDDFGMGRQYRYPNMRANHITRTFKNISLFGGLKHLLIQSSDSIQARINLTRNIVGIGPKQASLFLRNIGYSDDVAILDKHVLDYMYTLRISSKRFESIPTLGFYEKIEKRLLGYANSLQASMSILDTAIWVVMRVFKKGANV